MEKYANRMEELAEERAIKLRDAERLVAIGTTAGMVGHDIRNPLQSIDGSVYLAKQSIISSSAKTEEKKELLDELELINKQVAYIDHVVADLQDFAKSTEPQFAEMDVAGIIIESLGMVEVPENVIVNVLLPDEPLKLVADCDHVKRVLSNLVRNAVQAMPKGGELTILTYRKNDGVWIRVEDTGEGIAEDVKPHIFAPLLPSLRGRVSGWLSAKSL